MKTEEETNHFKLDNLPKNQTQQWTLALGATIFVLATTLSLIGAVSSTEDAMTDYPTGLSVVQTETVFIAIMATVSVLCFVGTFYSLKTAY